MDQITFPVEFAGDLPAIGIAVFFDRQLRPLACQSAEVVFERNWLFSGEIDEDEAFVGYVNVDRKEALRKNPVSACSDMYINPILTFSSFLKSGSVSNLGALTREPSCL